MIDSILQFFGTVSVVVLFCLCLILSSRHRTALFVSSGQDVFRWCALTLGIVFFTRILVFVDLLLPEPARTLNSVFFITSVLGIIWSVYRHAKLK